MLESLNSCTFLSSTESHENFYCILNQLQVYEYVQLKDSINSSTLSCKPEWVKIAVATKVAGTNISILKILRRHTFRYVP